MRTIVFATKQHIDSINKYKLFFSPFVKKDIVFCEWNTSGETVEEIIPAFKECLKGTRDWRAIVLFDSDEKMKKSRNPFDMVPPVFKFDSSEYEKESFIDKKIEKKLIQISEEEKIKIECYNKAATQPLTRLATFFCEQPLDAKEELAVENENKDDEKTSQSEICKEMDRLQKEQFNSYVRVSSEKSKLRSAILEAGKLDATLPAGIYCISLRTIKDAAEIDDERVSLVKNAGNFVQYSDFCDRNMYFDKMRFFVYDILPENHVNYRFEYLKFIYTVLIFAGNKFPTDSARGNRLYILESQSDEEKLKKLVQKYDCKLGNTITRLERNIKDINEEIPGPMSDDEMDNYFQSNEVIPVLFDKKFNMDGFFANKNSFGLANKCPRIESEVWNEMHLKSDERMHKLLKQPRRSVSKATGRFRESNKINSTRFLGLNDFQVEDIQEYVDKEQQNMVDVTTKDFYDLKRYEEKATEASDHVYDVLKTRMTKKTTKKLGFVVLGLFLLGYVPLIVYNTQMLSIPMAILFTALALLAFVITEIVSLFILRKQVKDSVEAYNAVMQDIKYDVDDSMSKFSNFLSSACRVMRGNSVLNAKLERDNIYKQRIRVLRSHIDKIRDKKGQLKDLFGDYFSEEYSDDAIEPYAYNFEIVKDYDYPLNLDKEIVSIPFIVSSNKVVVPLDIIEGIGLTMEEIYE